MAEQADAAESTRSVDIFLSYARADRTRAAKLAAALRGRGFTIWWDEMIEGGAAFASSIHRALVAADVVIVLWSKSSIESDWVRDEASLGRDRHRLVPISLDRSRAPLGFRQYQVVDLSGWRGNPDAPQIAAVARAVAAICERTVAAEPAPTRPRLSRRSVIAGAAAGLVGAGGYAGWRYGVFGAGVAADSIVILPFRNLSGDAAQAYFSDGLTEEFRAALARNETLKVMAGTSSAAAGSAGEDPIAIARKLAVAFVLDGTVRREDDMVRISVNLTDGKTGYSRWSQRFDRKLADIFAVQTEIADLVAKVLAVQIATTAPAPGGTTVLIAYEAYLRGRALFNAAKDEASDRAALDQYDQAIAADPQFALAHASRSRSLAAIAAEYAPADQLRALNDAAIAAADRAVAVAPDCADAQLALGYARLIGRLDVPGARPAYDRAFTLGHGDADILLLFALYAVRVGRGSEALGAIARALALDPLNPRTHRAAGSIHYSLRRYRTAIEHLERALKLNPGISNARALIGGCLYQRARFADARAAFAAETHLVFRLAGLAMTDFRLGDTVAAKRSMATIIAELGDSALYQQAEVLAQWGALPAAVAALERARAIGDSGLLYLATDPMLDPLTKLPAFRALLQGLHLG